MMGRTRVNGDINTILFAQKVREPKWLRLLILREPFSVYGSFGSRVFVFTALKFKLRSTAGESSVLTTRLLRYVVAMNSTT